MAGLRQIGSEEEAVWGSGGLQSSGELPTPRRGGLCQEGAVAGCRGDGLVLLLPLEPGLQLVTPGAGDTALAQGNSSRAGLGAVDPTLITLLWSLPWFPLSCG